MLHLCKPLIKAIEDSALKDRYPKSQVVTYKFFVGRKYMFDYNFKVCTYSVMNYMQKFREIKVLSSELEFMQLN